MKEFGDATTIAAAFSSTLGAIGAIWDAKKNPSRVNTPKTYKTVKPPS